jgi:hypothetical protein
VHDIGVPCEYGGLRQTRATAVKDLRLASVREMGIAAGELAREHDHDCRKHAVCLLGAKYNQLTILKMSMNLAHST